jgi:hypothetical protein
VTTDLPKIHNFATVFSGIYASTSQNLHFSIGFMSITTETWYSDYVTGTPKNSVCTVVYMAAGKA